MISITSDGTRAGVPTVEYFYILAFCMKWGPFLKSGQLAFIVSEVNVIVLCDNLTHVTHKHH